MMELELAQASTPEEGALVGVRVGPALNEDDTPSSAAIIIPTTAELMQYTLDADKYEEILSLQDECIQKSEEKVAIAQQAYDMVDSTVRRLEKDLEALEKMLQVLVTVMLVVRMCCLRG